MKAAEIIEALTYHTAYPYEAVAAAIDQPDEVIPGLLEVLEAAIEDLSSVADDLDNIGYIYAMYLLAQFREPRAYPLLVRFFSLPQQETLMRITGDLVTEDLGRMLASTCGGDIGLIQAMLEDRTLDEFIRSAAMSALVVLVAQGVKSREEILTYFQTLFREKLPRENCTEVDAYIWGSLVSNSLDLYPDMVIEDIRQAYAEDLVDETILDLAYVEEEMERGKAARLNKLQNDRHYTFINDTVAETKWWAMYQEKTPPRATTMPVLVTRRTGQVVRVGGKVGRNDLCPCGSGKKYKHCCGRSGGNA